MTWQSEAAYSVQLKVHSLCLNKHDALKMNGGTGPCVLNLSIKLRWLVSSIMMIMLMGRDYRSELQPPTGLLSILQVIHEHGEPWWKDINRGKYLICPPQITANPTKSHLVAKEMINFMLQVFRSYFKGFINMP
jgi:hypothetical protein